MKKLRTKLIHEGSHRRSHFGELSEALFLTQSYVYKTAEDAEKRFKGEDNQESYIYSRYGNPTVATFEDRMSILEGAESAFATASGMAAVSSVCLSFLRSGDHVISSRALFGSCFFVLNDILPRFNIDVTFVDGTDLSAWKNSIRPNTKMLFFETPSNPLLEVIDIAEVSGIAKSCGAIVVVDNVLSTPCFQRPLEHGADVVIYSTTKHVDGQGRCLGGVILSGSSFIKDVVQPFMRNTGASISPFNAWVMLKGLETLELRCREQEKTSIILTNFLSSLSGINFVRSLASENHPQRSIIKRQMNGFGTVLAFEVDGGKDRAFKFMNNLEIILISNNLGDAKSIITHPATTTHSKISDQMKSHLGITPGLIRLSVGLEDPEDLKNDLQRALEISKFY